MKTSWLSWGERYLYAPGPLERLLSILLLPLSWLYCVLMYLRYLRLRPKDLGVNVISVGNLTVGGSGKTPLVSALARRYENAAVVLRGYGRQSSGLIVVSDRGRIACDVTRSGDEAMIYAHKLPRAVVIVSESREEGIQKAKAMGCDIVFLDDGYGKHQIKKLDLVIEVETANNSCLPSGPYRERLWCGKDAVVVREGHEFTRRVSVVDSTPKMVLVTAIARPQRLDAYLPDVAGKHYFPDHHFFSEEELRDIFRESGATSLLVTYKDYVKIANFNLPLSLLDLELQVHDDLMDTVDYYVEENG